MFAALPISMTAAILGLATAFVMTDIAKAQRIQTPITGGEDFET